MKNIESSFLQLMRIALGNAATLDAPLSAEEWEELFDMSTKHGVSGIAFSGVEKLPKEQMPPLEVIMDWSAVAEYIEEVNRHQNSVSVKVCDAFERDGVRACIVKGASVGVLYPEPLRRNAGDVDVWMSGGYEAVAEYARKRFPYFHGGHYGRHIEVTADGVQVEIHFMPAELYSFQHRIHLKALYREIEAKAWMRRVELKGSGSIIVPELEETLIIVIVHLFSHFAVEGVGMKQVLDCYWVLKEVGKADAGKGADTEGMVDKKGMADTEGKPVGGKSADETREWAMSFFRKVGIGKFVAALMYVLQQLGLEERLMLCAPDEKWGKRLLDDIMDKGVVSVDVLVDGKYGAENKASRFFRRLSRAVRMLPMAPSEMLWMLQSGISYWLSRKG
ncbi:MAG: nucleotidyltransferase family protein [Prevotellaceae bacterium]|nr:nucleotidyltransferase family protein [Prevotellaceae bacterium]